MTSITESLVKYPLHDAQDCIRNYITNARNSGIKEENIIRAYTVKAEDIIGVLDVTDKNGKMSSKYSFFRAYLGQKSDFDNHSEFTFKLFLVPVIEDDKGGFIDVIPRGEDGEEFVYDFNTPCPNSCDYLSKLYIR